MSFLTAVDISFSLPVPTILVRIAVWIVLLYRRLRYGYTFRRIKLTRGQYAIVDPEDFERLNQYKWHCTCYGYACRKVPKKFRKSDERTSLMHKELCPVPDGKVVDHINRNKLDNRKVNLRPATKQQNCWNAKYKRKTIKTRYSGIHWNKNLQKWQVCLTVKGQRARFGYYADETQAAKKYDEKAKKYRGEYAVLNFPEK